MSKKQDSREEIRRAIGTMRKEMQKVTKDLASATQEIVQSTQKVVRDYSPKVAATLDETMKDTSQALRRAMSNIDNQTKGQQVKLLQSYKSFLYKQADIIEKRLNKLKK
jgi:hypothetical protein